jgi:hypothetical protein
VESPSSLAGQDFKELNDLTAIPFARILTGGHHSSNKEANMASLCRIWRRHCAAPSARAADG